MRRKTSASGSGGLEGGCCLVIVAIILMNIIFGGICTSYTCDSFTGKQPPFAVSVVAGLFLGEFTIPIAAGSWLFRSAGVQKPFLHQSK